MVQPLLVGGKANQLPVVLMLLLMLGAPPRCPPHNLPSRTLLKSPDAAHSHSLTFPASVGSESPASPAPSWPERLSEEASASAAPS